MDLSRLEKELAEGRESLAAAHAAELRERQTEWEALMASEKASSAAQHEAELSTVRSTAQAAIAEASAQAQADVSKAEHAAQKALSQAKEASSHAAEADAMLKVQSLRRQSSTARHSAATAALLAAQEEQKESNAKRLTNLVTNAFRAIRRSHGIEDLVEAELLIGLVDRWFLLLELLELFALHLLEVGVLGATVDPAHRANEARLASGPEGAGEPTCNECGHREVTVRTRRREA